VSTGDPAVTPPHARDADAVLVALGGTRDGLASAEAVERLARHGPNRLLAVRAQSPLLRFLRQFHNVLIYVLLASAVVTGLLEHWIDTGVILAVVLVNAAIGAIQEGKAERALDAIRSLLSPEALALRDGERRLVPAADLVPGDVVIVQSGDKVPADLRLLRSTGLRCEEAALTGESVPVEKTDAPVAADAALGDRTCIAFSGTLVTSGHALGVVTATGEGTEIGRISAMLGRVRAMRTPLLVQVARFGHVVAAAVCAVAAGTFLFGWLVRDYPVGEMFLAGVGLAVAAIPEGLPAILTITLAIGVQRMARRHAIIRRLPAVDTLGSVTVICSDKTGTLTRNEMMVASAVLPDDELRINGSGYAPDGAFHRDGREVGVSELPALRELALAGLLCNEARLRHEEGTWRLVGDPTEGALVALATKADLEQDLEERRWPRIDAIPFESEHRFMATLHHHHDGRRRVFVKGAPERILEMCSHQGDPAAAHPLDAARWTAAVDSLAARGERVLAIASANLAEARAELDFADVEGGLTLLGLVGLIDPPRAEAAAAVAECRRAGIRVKMITGDHARTAAAIGERLGIGDGRALDGAAIDRMDDAELAAAVRDVDVFARVSPEHKLRLVDAVQAGDHVVAMTGDGVNDAPALKRAAVGVAMGDKGTEVAKEASDIVLTDDDFTSIVHAVREGRTVYDNLRKAVLFILPTNGAEALILIAAIFAGRALPLTPVQILWVNLVTAVTLALALAFEPPERDVMRRPPRPPRSRLLPPYFLWRIAAVSLIVCAAVFGLFVALREGGTPVETARSVAVNALVFFEVCYLFNCRSITGPLLGRGGPAGNPWAWAAAAAVLVLQALYTYLPLSRRLFDMRPVGPGHWAIIAAMGLGLFVLLEVEKACVRRWRHRGRRDPPKTLPDPA